MNSSQVNQLEARMHEHLTTHANGHHHNGDGHHAPHMKLQLFDQVNLKQMFPVSWRFVIQRSIGVIALWVLVAVPSIRLIGIEGIIHPERPFEILSAVVLALLGVAVGLRMLFEALELCALDYETDGFRLVIRRGVLFRKAVSLPLLPITEIYIERDFLDLLFALYDLNVATPVTGAKAYGLFQGLNRKNAQGLQHFLSKQLNRQIFLADQPQGVPIDDPEEYETDSEEFPEIQ